MKGLRKAKAHRFCTLVVKKKDKKDIAQLVPQSGAFDEESDNVEEVDEIGATCFEKESYEGEVRQCPDNVPGDLVERSVNENDSKIALYFEDINKWCEGYMTQVHRGKKHKVNVLVYCPEDRTKYKNFCVANQPTVVYGFFLRHLVPTLMILSLPLLCK